MLALTLIRTLDLTKATAPGRAPHIAAASGLIRAGNHLYVIGDDESHLGVFPAAGSNPGKLIQLLDGELPMEPAARKARKPDFEALALIPASNAFPHGALFALGSGSTATRRRGVVLALNTAGDIASEPKIINMAPLFTTLDAIFPEPNIEGAVIRRDELLLFQRGNVGNPENAIVRTDLATVLALRSPASLSVERVRLGEISGVPLCFTDAAALPSGDIVFSAIAEDTVDSYRDGALVGAAVGVLNANLQLMHIEPIEPLVKVEGIDSRIGGRAIELLLVTDADDAAKSAGLYSARLVV
ncbi:MAG TPA: hypothetical protein VMF90_17630 [Rhizobiaceae bacterium]|nr:hypothetical protein [Rhizobiaceae bacterium]